MHQHRTVITGGRQHASRKKTHSGSGAHCPRLCLRCLNITEGGYNARIQTTVLRHCRHMAIQNDELSWVFQTYVHLLSS